VFSKTRLTLPILSLVMLSLLGCDSQASQQAKAQKYLESARTKLRAADVGYVLSAAGASGESANLQAYRQESMDAVFADLNEVLKLDAPQQKLQALLISAVIDASAARYAARQAATENAVLAGRSTTLLGYLTALEGSSSRAIALKPQEALILEKLNEEIVTQSVVRDELSARAGDLNTRLEAVNAKANAFKARADEGYAKAQALQEQAFVARGDRMYDLQDQASKLERAAAVESAAAEREQVVARDLLAELELTASQLTLTEQLVSDLSNQVTQTQARAVTLENESAAAAQAAGQAATTMAEEFTQIADVHAKAVQAKMDQAGKRIDKAVASLEQAVGLATDRDTKQTAKLQLLSAYVDQAHIATSHAIYVGGLASTTRVLAESARKLTPQDAGAYTDRLETLLSSQADLNTRADEAVQTGKELAAELAPEGSTLEEGGSVEIALKQRNHLDIYEKRRYDHELH
jgi:hypothetical protein